MHYTIVAAILAGGALFIWETEKGRALPVCLLGLCYLVRSQVFFLAMPFLGVAVLDGLLEAMRRRRGERQTEGDSPGLMAWACVRLRKEALSLLGLGILILAFWGIHRMGYGSRDWQAYLEYNDSRTELYDYTDFLSTDWYQERYELLGLTREQYQVLAHYDTLLDQEIDARVLDRTVRRIKDLRGDVVTDVYLRQCVEAYLRHPAQTRL